MSSSGFVSELLSGIVATVIGGSLLTLLFFFAKEKLFPLPKIAGRWHFETQTVDTAYKPFAGMILRYVATMWQEGSIIHGTFEKTYENSSTGKREYVGSYRSRGTIESCIYKHYLSKDRIYIHLVEEGKTRTSTIFFDLVSESSSEMSGSFQSMAADQTGAVSLRRGQCNLSQLSP